MNATNTVPWDNDPQYFQSGERVEVHSFGRWYPGTVAKIGRTRVTVFYRTGSGAERTKAFAPSKVRPVSSADTTKAKKSERLDFQPMKILASVPIGLAMRKFGHFPSVPEMVRFTRDNPDLFPRPWTAEEAKFCLENPSHVLSTVQP